MLPPNWEPAFEKDITLPTAWPEPPFIIVTDGVDESPSMTTLAVVPVPEPVVLVCVIS